MIGEFVERAGKNNWFSLYYCDIVGDKAGCKIRI